ncbi:MAG: sodium-dependent transporter [Gammaproteobacteria bacterium]|nr:sodium-dependent transporter [Gammaproteobacteria bacterium]
MTTNVNDRSQHGMWSSKMLFVLAAVGSAVGLGNIWKFPYMMAEQGGGAFFLFYLICIALIGFPVMAAEIMVGREGRMSPVNSILRLAQEHNRSKNWSLMGWAGVVGGVVILSFYAVIAGWIMFYVWRMFSGEFTGIEAAASGEKLGSFLASPWKVLLWFSVFIAIVVFFVARGVNRGLELAIRICMPLLFVLLIVMLIYGVAQGGFMDSVRYMFDFDFSKMTWETPVAAMGHAFFTLSIGMGAIMAYGAYMPREGSVKSAVGIIIVIDTLVAIVAGLAIFSIVFAMNLETDKTVGLLFITAPAAFGNLPLGAIFGGLFFLFVGFAAFTSAISLTEPAIAYFVEKFKTSRVKIALATGVITWTLGLLSVLSFNVLKEFPFGNEDWNFFEIFDKTTTFFLLPVVGLIIAVFVGWFLPWDRVRKGLEIQSELAWTIWIVAIRFVAPFAILVFFLFSFYEKFIAPFLGG